MRVTFQKSTLSTRETADEVMASARHQSCGRKDQKQRTQLSKTRHITQTGNKRILD